MMFGGVKRNLSAIEPSRPGVLGSLWTLGTALVTHPSGRGRRPATIARALAWQIAKATGARRARICFGPLELFCYPGNTSASSVLYFGMPEWDDMQFVLRYLRPGECMIDVGANIGAYALLAATVVENVKVFAVEPDGDALMRLEENISLNPRARIEVVRAALGSEVGEGLLTVGRDTVNRLALPGDPATARVVMTTLDRLAERAAPALIKIDVEGAELAVLRGGEATLAATPAPAVLLEINEGATLFGVALPDVVRFFEERRYSLFEYAADSNALTPWDGTRLPRSGNCVAARDPGRVRTRLDDPQPSVEELRAASPRVWLER